MATKNKRADRVWDRLIQSYGTRVAEMYGIDMPKPWIDAVEDLTDAQIAFGLRAVLKESPIHPPALGQFVQCSSNMPIAQSAKGPATQEQLMEYAALKLRGRLSTQEYSRPWTYLYREWWDAARPKGMEKCAECTGVVIDLDDGTRIGFQTADMLADTDGHARALRMFRPGAAPTRQQLDAFHNRFPDLATHREVA